MTATPNIPSVTSRCAALTDKLGTLLGAVRSQRSKLYQGRTQESYPIEMNRSADDFAVGIGQREMATTLDYSNTVACDAVKAGERADIVVCCTEQRGWAQTLHDLFTVGPSQTVMWHRAIRGIAAGDVSVVSDPEQRASFVMAVRSGMSSRARDGANSDVVMAIAEIGLAAQSFGT